VIGFENNYDDDCIPIIEYLQDKNFVVFHESTLDIFMIHKSSMFFSNIDKVYILENSV